ncbi:acyl carrier protein [Bermanella marisrubri]|uniref:Putative acyl carrier protein n=1 Tax=Bermanella marisrubri TaxID=207949 RepID=Q1N371_9GAMM|nr:phosphopantetheine-binding protein [Bermanella marisrubri]EAT12720.1 putative acyl carrier protein [Oceanobacter sp. RED65] [Bermanella marisrubri]QIZ85161.1 acyl carrier protein [Bermanella marisrubri]
MQPELQKQIEERKAVLDEVKRVLIERLNLYQEPQDIDEDTPLFGSGLRLDSVDATEVVVMLDMSFGIKVPEGTDPSFMRNINKLVDFILEHKSAQQAA